LENTEDYISLYLLSSVLPFLFLVPGLTYCVCYFSVRAKVIVLVLKILSSAVFCLTPSSETIHVRSHSYIARILFYWEHILLYSFVWRSCGWLWELCLVIQFVLYIYIYYTNTHTHTHTTNANQQSCWKPDNSRRFRLK